ncbi:hypothetical protein MRX96_005780 [Rhipicephalus microplus]
MDDELSLCSGDVVTVHSRAEDGWWHGEKDGHWGVFPASYVQELRSDRRFFGVVRSFRQSIIRQSSDNDHPTIVQFSQIYRILSLFTPVKNTVKRNCSGQADTVLVSLHKSLGEKAKAAAEIKRAVEAKLHKKLFGIAASEGK